ncbi:MAG: hypothetical protein ACT4QF_22775 [Sporichthyaceae bacterium]
MTVGMQAGVAQAAENAFDFQNSSYILTLRSGGIETYATIPRELPQDVGHSFVDLIHDIGQPKGRCETLGAGYWLGTEVEEGVLGAGAAPPDAGDVVDQVHVAVAVVGGQVARNLLVGLHAAGAQREDVAGVDEVEGAVGSLGRGGRHPDGQRQRTGGGGCGCGQCSRTKAGHVAYSLIRPCDRQAPTWFVGAIFRCTTHMTRNERSP